MTEKQLHVRVAEALGCSPYQPANDPSVAARRFWLCSCPAVDGLKPHGGSEPELEWYDKLWNNSGWVKHYDTDWSATGPLIEQLDIAIAKVDKTMPDTWGAKARPEDRSSEVWFESGDESFGPTPLIAVCNLILALHEEGKLKELLGEKVKA